MTEDYYVQRVLTGWYVMRRWDGLGNRNPVWVHRCDTLAEARRWADRLNAPRRAS